jgi:hypothetical protein
MEARRAHECARAQREAGDEAVKILPSALGIASECAGVWLACCVPPRSKAGRRSFLLNRSDPDARGQISVAIFANESPRY